MIGKTVDNESNITKSFKSKSSLCSDKVFGDPAVGHVKACWCKEVTKTISRRRTLTDIVVANTPVDRLMSRFEWAIQNTGNWASYQSSNKKWNSSASGLRALRTKAALAYLAAKTNNGGAQAAWTAAKKAEAKAKSNYGAASGRAGAAKSAMNSANKKSAAMKKINDAAIAMAKKVAATAAKNNATAKANGKAANAKQDGLVAAAGKASAAASKSAVAAGKKHAAALLKWTQTKAAYKAASKQSGKSSAYATKMAKAMKASRKAAMDAHANFVAHVQTSTTSGHF